MATQEDLRWLKKEFVSVWKSTWANVKSLPQSNTKENQETDVDKGFSKIAANEIIWSGN